MEKTARLPYSKFQFPTNMEIIIMLGLIQNT